MKGDEARVVAAFTAHLEAEGWGVQHEVEFIDVVATRDGVTLRAEAKGRTTAAGLDADTMYGQLLRRMREPSDGRTNYAVVVPDAAVAAALRVPEWVRDWLRISVYAVSDQDDVVRVSSPAPSP